MDFAFAQGATTLVSITIAAAMTFVFAYARFNQPSTARSSTTAFRYHLGATTYATAFAAGYLVLLATPQVVGLFWPDLPPRALSPFVVAFLLTVFLEASGPLKRIDEWARERFHALAAIPTIVRKLRNEIYTASCPETAERRSQVESEFRETNLDPSYVCFDPDHPAQFTWTRVALLMHVVRSWESRPDGFAGFAASHRSDLHNLKQQYEFLAVRAAHLIACDHMRKPESDPDVEGLLSHYEREFSTDAERLLFQLSELIAHAVLHCGRTSRVRSCALNEMGFSNLSVTPGLSLNQRLAVFLVILVIFMVMFVGAGRETMPPTDRLLLAVTVSIANWIGICWALAPVEWGWRIARRDADGFPPIAYYLVVAALTVVTSVLVRLFGKILIMGPAAVWTIQNWAPWALMDVGTAVAIAIHVERRENARPRWLEALSVCGVVALGAVGARTLLGLYGAHQASFGRLLIYATVFGFTVGWCVPTWWRRPSEHAVTSDELPLPPWRLSSISGTADGGAA